MATSNIVVFDPSGEFWEGALVEEYRARQLAARGATVLPVETDLFGQSGVGGYHRRAWGSGWPMGNPTPKGVCPLTLFVDRDLHTLSWAARLVPDPESGLDWRDYRGALRLVLDNAQALAQMGGLNGSGMVVVSPDTLGEPDTLGGWVVQGKAQMNAGGPGHVGLTLYGSAAGLRVLWAAVALSR